MASKIIAVSEFTKKEIEKYYHIPAEKIAAIHNGVDFESFNQTISTEKLEEVKRKYNLPENFILYVGTFQPRKNIPVVIEALKDLDIKLVLAGNRKAHNFDKRIDETIGKNNLGDRVIFPGWIDEEDKPALYKLARCFVFPSLYEGFGIPIIEAMAAGTPVVSSDIPCLTEVGGEGALFADPKKPQEFAKKIREILSDKNLRDSLIKKGVEIAKSYTWQKNAEKTLGVYSGLAN
jgi:glycosyltransferase involved in cell wall biosynthesis